MLRRVAVTIRSTDSYRNSDALEISKHSHVVESGFLFHLCERIIKLIISRNVKKKEKVLKNGLTYVTEFVQILKRKISSLTK